jgi:hypothetical protein
MAESSRTGRVSIAANGTKTIFVANLVGNRKAIYRIFNSGKVGETVKVFVDTVDHDLEWKDSLDLSIGNQKLSVTAGGQTAEIVYELLNVV